MLESPNTGMEWAVYLGYSKKDDEAAELRKRRKINGSNRRGMTK